MEKIIMLTIALLINLIMIVCELYTLAHIRKKTDILKYYTYLHNLLALVVSVVFFVCLIVCMVSGREIPEFIRGLRYVATCGLVATMILFLTLLGAGKRVTLTEDDFLSGFSPKIANAILHYICPVLSLLSFVVFERELLLSNGIWTSITAIPSCLYWIAYIVLSATKLWEEPYAFVAPEGKSKIREVLPFFIFPLLFIAISFVVWIAR